MRKKPTTMATTYKLWEALFVTTGLAFAGSPKIAKLNMTAATSISTPESIRIAIYGEQ